jgi:hypothetical protein
MSKYIKREISLAITFVLGMFFILYYFVSDPLISAIRDRLTIWSTLITSTMIALGLINLFIVHIRRIQVRQTGWPFSIWLLFGIIFTAALSVQQGILAGVRTSDAPILNWIVWNVNTQIQITIFSLFGFYVVSAAIHGLQIRSRESLLFVIMAVLIFLWNAPLGTVIWEGFGPLGTWVSTYIAGSTFSAITLCVSVGSLALGIRTILGYERGYLGAE